MSNAITTAASAAIGGAIDIASLKKSAKKTAGDLPQGAGQNGFLKLEKSGLWTYGSQRTEVEEGSLWAINPASYRHGYVCWTDFVKKIHGKTKNEKLGEVMVPLGKDKPATTDLKTYMDDVQGEPWDWSDCAEVQLVCLSGEDEGTTLTYNVNSKGGINLLNEWFSKFLAQLDDADPKPVAVVELESDSYENKNYGLVTIPEFKYVEWRGLDDGAPVEQAEPEEDEPKKVADSGGAEPEPTQDEDPAPRRRRRPAAETADEGDAPAPTRRRRRPAA